MSEVSALIDLGGHNTADVEGTGRRHQPMAYRSYLSAVGVGKTYVSLQQL